MKRKILIVDDEEEVLRYLSRRVEREDYEPIVAYDGKEAFEMVLKHKVDAVLTDIVMSGMDGYELCQKLKESDGLADIPVVICTAYANQERTFRKLGIDDYFVKPVPFDNLVNSLKRIFGQVSHAIKYKKVLVQTNNPLPIQMAVQQVTENGFRIDTSIVAEEKNLIEEVFRVQPDIVIFNALKEKIVPDELIRSLHSYSELKDVDVVFYMNEQSDKKGRKGEQSADEKLRDRCLAAGAAGFMGVLNKETFLNVLFYYCKSKGK